MLSKLVNQAMTLTNPSDAELDAAFAERVAGWVPHRQMILDKHFVTRWAPPGTPEAFNLLALDTSPPAFTDSMDAVLPYLERLGWRGTSNRAGSTCAATIEVNSHEADGSTHIAQADDTRFANPLAAACVLALLRAHGVEVVFK